MNNSYVISTTHNSLITGLGEEPSDHVTDAVELPVARIRELDRIFSDVGSWSKHLSTSYPGDDHAWGRVSKAIQGVSNSAVPALFAATLLVSPTSKVRDTPVYRIDRSSSSTQQNLNELPKSATAWSEQEKEFNDWNDQPRFNYAAAIKSAEILGMPTEYPL